MSPNSRFFPSGVNSRIESLFRLAEEEVVHCCYMLEKGMSISRSVTKALFLPSGCNFENRPWRSIHKEIA